MRRLVALAIAVVLVAAGCGGGGDDDASKPTTTTEAATGTTVRPTTSLPTGDEVEISDDCPGIGAVPDAAAITWIADDHLWQAPADDPTDRTCLLDAAYPGVEWGGEADRVRIGDAVVVGTELMNLGGDRHLGSFSRPGGRVVLARQTDGNTVKVPLDGTDTFYLPSIYESTDTEYHPSGLAIVSAQPRGERPGLLLSTNLGVEARWLVDNETAHELRGLTFTESGDLLFVAAHDDGDHVHRYDFETNTLSVELDTDGDVHVDKVVASPFSDDDVAISREQDEALTDLWVQRDGEEVGLDGTGLEHGRPVAWLPDGGLLVGVYEGDVHCCDIPPYDLYLLSRSGTVTRVARDVAAAAVRAVLPPPPPAPPRIDEAAPA